MSDSTPNKLFRNFRFCNYCIIFFVFCASCSSDGVRFSQLPGFTEYFNNIPPGLPNTMERALLEQYKPQHFLKAGQTKPIDFYDEYLANGRLHYCDGQTISENVTSEVLNKHRDDPNVCFDFVGFSPKEHESYPLYARIDYGKWQDKTLTFLSYNLVFASSGVIKGIPWYKSALLRLVGSLDDWHQLDNYIMACVVLNSQKQPIALILQQHNYTTTYLPGVQLPRKNWWQVDVAVRSNELYPHSPEPKKHRSVSFIDQKSLAYLHGSGRATLMSGYDHTYGEELLSTHLVFLPREDAFYRFLGRLGKKRLLPGSSAPPGAEFNTLPAFKPLPVTLLISYRRPGEDKEYQKIFARFFKGFNSSINSHDLSLLAARMREDLQNQGLDF